MAKKKKNTEQSDASEKTSEPGRVTAKVWMERIKRSLKYRDKIKKDQEWSRLQQEYEGKYSIKLNGMDAAPINLVFGYVDTAAARLYFRDPHMTVNPKGAESINAARILETDVNYSFGQLKVKETGRRALVDGLVIGHGWVKLGYISEIGKMESDPGTEPNEYIKGEEIFISYVPWEDIIFDTSLSKNPPYDCRWIAHRIVKPLSEIKKDHNYENTGNLSSNVNVREMPDKDERAKQEVQDDSDISLFEFWEVTDLDTKKVYAVCDQSDKFIREQDYKYEMKGFNYCMLKFNIVNNKPYPISDVFLIEPQILERIKLRGAQLNHIKRWSRQLSIEEGAMNKEEMEKFTQGVDGAVTQRRKGSAPPVPIEYAAMQAEIFALDSLIQSDSDAVIGQSDLDRGAPPKTNAKTTKFQLQEQNQGTSVRQNSKQDKLEDFLEEIAEKYIALVKQYQDMPKYVRITGMTPEAIKAAFGSIKGVTVDATGIKYTKEAIKGEYDVEAKAGSTLPLNRENRVNLIGKLLETGPAIGITPGSPTSIALGKALLRELDMKDVEVAYAEQAEMMKNAPPPQQPQGKKDNVVHHVHHQGPPAKPKQAVPQGPVPPPNAQ